MEQLKRKVITHLRKLHKDIEAKQANIKEAEEMIKFLESKGDQNSIDSARDCNWQIDHELEPPMELQKKRFNVLCEALKFTEVMNEEERQANLKFLTANGYEDNTREQQ